MTDALFEQLTAPDLRDLIAPFLAQRVQGASVDNIQAMVEGWTLDDYQTLLDGLRVRGKEHHVYDAHTRCRTLCRSYMRLVFPSVDVAGTDFLRRAMQDGPTVVVTNHLSYIDAVAMDAMLSWSGADDLANALVFLAGPKVYEELFRLLAVSSIHSLPVPQSSRMAHTQALSRRELVMKVRQSLDASAQTLQNGRTVVFYPEGSRSRTGRMGSWLQATRRYVQPATFIVPGALVGTGRAMPLDTKTLIPSPARLQFGPPIRIESGGGREALEEARRAVCELLPASHRPEEDTPPLV